MTIEAVGPSIELLLLFYQTAMLSEWLLNIYAYTQPWSQKASYSSGQQQSAEMRKWSKS